MPAAFAFLSLAAAALCFAQTPVYDIRTIAGSDWVGDHGPATSAVFAQAEGIAFDAAGNMYVADAAQHRVRKIAKGIITTFAGTGAPGFSGDGGPATAAQLNAPYGLMFDGAGNLLIADLGNARVRRVTADGNIATVAGGGSAPAVDASDGTGALLVALDAPRNLCSDGRGGFYVSDFGANTVYRVASDGSFTKAAGSGEQGYSGDGYAATQAQLANPAGIAMDRNGSLYIADSGNHVVRRVAGGIISTIQHAATPTSVTVDSFGTLYIADPGAGEIVAVPSNAAGSAFQLQATDLAFGLDGYLYATSASVVRRVSFSGPSLVIAGGGDLAHGDGAGATDALLNHPAGIAVDGDGNLYIADRDNNRVRRVATDGTITTIAGTGAPGNSGDFGGASQATLSAPSAVTLDPFGDLYVVDSGNRRIRWIAPSGILYPLNVDGLVNPAYAVRDSKGNVWISDSGNGTILEVAPSGTIATVLSGLQSPGALTVDPNGGLYFVDGKHIRRLNPAGDITSLAEGMWIAPRGLALGSAGDLFVADAGLNAVVRIDSSGNFALAGGTGDAGFSGDGGPALSAQLNSPSAICVDANGGLDIADLANNRIRQMTPEAVAVSDSAVVVVNAASLQPGPVAPGMLVDLLVAGFSASDAPNLQVMFGTIDAPILAVDGSRLLVQVPAQIDTSSPVTIAILDQGALAGQASAAVATAAPALFADSDGQASALNQDGTVNSASNPAALGSILVLYGTGQGVGTNPVTVTIGGYQSQVLYSGPVAGYPGLWQVNITLPSGYVAPGALNVIASVGPFATQAGVTISAH